LGISQGVTDVSYSPSGEGGHKVAPHKGSTPWIELGSLLSRGEAGWVPSQGNAPSPVGWTRAALGPWPSDEHSPYKGSPHHSGCLFTCNNSLLNAVHQMQAESDGNERWTGNQAARVCRNGDKSQHKWRMDPVAPPRRPSLPHWLQRRLAVVHADRSDACSTLSVLGKCMQRTLGPGCATALDGRRYRATPPAELDQHQHQHSNACSMSGPWIERLLSPG
jgi:hypothetical protein